jgi:hypothetical protein
MKSAKTGSHPGSGAATQSSGIIWTHRLAKDFIMSTTIYTFGAVAYI